jgi:hypothetical protein
MTITSRIQKGHGTDTGQGNGYGYQKKALADGAYTMDVSGLNVVNHGTPSQDSAFTKLADGTSMSTEVRQGSITIDAIGGETALHLVTDNNNGRLRVNDAFDAAHQIKLGDLDHLSFDYYIQSSDRSDVTPVIRIAIDADGDLSTTNDRGELVFEWAYQGFGATTTGSWQHADLAGGDWNAWQRSNGANRDVYPDIVHLSNWADADGYTPAGGLHFDDHSVVLGWSIAYGSGNGTGSMYLDHLEVGTATVNFA